MALVQQGKRDPERERQARRQERLATVKAKHKGKRVSQMSAAERQELLEAIAVVLGLADDGGVVL